MMLRLESHSQLAECQFCKQVTNIADLVGNEVVTKMEFNQRKEWMESYKNKRMGQDGVEKALIDEDCPKCDSKQMYYMTRQMRSADEGQTVFYECIKCGYKFSVNT